MGRGKRTAGSRRAGTAATSTATLEEAVGVRDNPAYPLSRLAEDLCAPLAVLRHADERNQGKGDEAEDWETLKTRELYDALLPVWDELWQHYHEARQWSPGSPFDELLWATADMCERLDKEMKERYSQDLIDPPEAKALLAAYDRFQDAVMAFERRVLEVARPGSRQRPSGLAERAA